MVDSYFGNHLSMSEWALRASLSSSDAILREDSDKRSRLQVLSDETGLPIVRAVEFISAEVLHPSERFEEFRTSAPEPTLYAARGRSSDRGMPVLRARGKTLRELMAWITSLPDLSSYTFSFEQHVEAELAAVFVVGQARIAGEALEGGILALNSGTFEQDQVTAFELGPDGWQFSRRPPQQVERFLRQALACVRVDDDEVRDSLGSRLEVKFVEGYLGGYFEVITSAASGLVFIDYNRVIAGDLPPLSRQGAVASDDTVIAEGRAGCSGSATGRARVVAPEEVDNVVMSPQDILVCQFTDPGILPLMTTAAAVVTDVGGVLSHAAIVCRELGKPCVVGTAHATARIATGDWIEVNADEGVIRRAAPVMN